MHIWTKPKADLISCHPLWYQATMNTTERKKKWNSLLSDIVKHLMTIPLNCEWVRSKWSKPPKKNFSQMVLLGGMPPAGKFIWVLSNSRVDRHIRAPETALTRFSKNVPRFQLFLPCLAITSALNIFHQNTFYQLAKISVRKISL